MCTRRDNPSLSCLRAGCPCTRNCSVFYFVRRFGIFIYTSDNRSHIPPPGSRFERLVPDRDTMERYVCGVCGHIYYRNPKIVADPWLSVTIASCCAAVRPSRERFWDLACGIAGGACDAPGRRVPRSVGRIEIALILWEDIPWTELAFPGVAWTSNHYRDTKDLAYSRPGQSRLAGVRFFLVILMFHQERHLRHGEQEDQRHHAPDLEIHPDVGGEVAPDDLVHDCEHEKENTVT